MGVKVLGCYFQEVELERVSRVIRMNQEMANVEVLVFNLYLNTDPLHWLV